MPLSAGCELWLAFPESASHPSGATSSADAWSTTLAADDPGAPQPGDFVRYRVRTIDAIGRPSLDVDRDRPGAAREAPAAAAAGRPDGRRPGALAGVQVRVLVRDAPDLTADRDELLGADDHAIVLRWGWHAEQRQQDPLRARVPPLCRRRRWTG